MSVLAQCCKAVACTVHWLGLFQSLFKWQYLKFRRLFLHSSPGPILLCGHNSKSSATPAMLLSWVISKFTCDLLNSNTSILFSPLSPPNISRSKLVCANLCHVKYSQSCHLPWCMRSTHGSGILPQGKSSAPDLLTHSTLHWRCSGINKLIWILETIRKLHSLSLARALIHLIEYQWQQILHATALPI